MPIDENYHDLYVFMLVAQEGSFTKAAARLGTAQSGVSRTVSHLERRLGVRLLTRTTRKLSLTHAGAQFYQSLQNGFAQVDTALTQLAHYRDTPSGTVRINASQHAIEKILLPKLADFARLYPDIRLELISENRLIDITDEHFDAGIRMGSDVAENMVAVRISLEMEMAAVATPEHFRRYGLPHTPQDLAMHPCIAYQFADGSLYPWPFQQNGHTVTHMPQGQWAFADSHMEAEAARLSLGMAYVPLDLVADDIAAGRLTRVLPTYSERLPAQYLYYPHRNISPALRLVAERLKV